MIKILNRLLQAIEFAWDKYTQKKVNDEKDKSRHNIDNNDASAELDRLLKSGL